MVVRLFFHFLEFERDGGLLLHGLFDLRPGQLRPRRGNDHGIVILLANQVNAGVELGLGHAIRAGEDDGVGRFDLVVVELAEVLHVHFALRRVRYGDKIAELHFVIRHALHSLDDVRQLADAGRLDQDAVGCVLGHNLLQRLAEVAHERAADAAGVHLGDGDAGLLQKAAVDADLAEFVLDQHELFAGIGFLDHLLDERRLARAEKAGINIDSGHEKHLLFLFLTNVL